MSWNARDSDAFEADQFHFPREQISTDTKIK